MDISDLITIEDLPLLPYDFVAEHFHLPLLAAIAVSWSLRWMYCRAPQKFNDYWNVFVLASNGLVVALAFVAFIRSTAADQLGEMMAYSDVKFGEITPRGVALLMRNFWDEVAAKQYAVIFLISIIYLRGAFLWAGSWSTPGTPVAEDYDPFDCDDDAEAADESADEREEWRP